MTAVRTSLVRALLLFATGSMLVGLVLWDRQQRRLADEHAQAASRPWTLPPSDVDAIEIVARDRHLRVERRGSTWFVVEPFEDLADAAVVDELLFALTELHLARVLAEGDGLSLTTLDLLPPRQSYVLRSPQGLFRLELGRRHPIDGGSYARAVNAQGQVFLGVLAKEQALLLSWPPSQLRDRRLLRFRPDQVRRVELVRDATLAAARLVITRSSDKAGPTWTLSTGPRSGQALPPPQPADTEAILNLLGELAAATYGVGSQTPPDAVDVPMPDADTLEVLVTVADGTARRVSLFPAGGVRARVWMPDRMLSAWVTSDLLALVRVAPENLLDRRVLRFDPEQVNEIELQFGPSQLAVLKQQHDSDETWSLVVPRVAAVAGWRVSALLVTLGALRPTTTADTDNTGEGDACDLSSPRLRVILRDRAGQVLEALDVGPSRGRSTCVRTDALATTAMVSRALVDEIPAELPTFVRWVVRQKGAMEDLTGPKNKTADR